MSGTGSTEDGVVRTGDKRLHFLDALRGVAALCVVVAHYVFDLTRPELGSTAGTDLIARFDSVFDIGKFGVVLFFLISGFIIPNSLGPKADRIGRFVVSRLFRLYPLYWFALLFGVLLPWPVLEHGYPGGVVLANVTMVQGYLHKVDIIGAAWTLQIELTFYGVCVVMASRHLMRSPRACSLVSGGFLALALVLAVARYALVMKLPVALPLALSVMFFGTVWRQATLDKLSEARWFAPRLLAAIAAMIVPISLLAYNHDFGFNERWLPYATCYLTALAVFVLCTTRLVVEWRPLVWVGEISYSLYLVHPLVAAGCFYAGLTVFAMPVVPQAWAGPIILLAVACSWLTHRVVEMPFVALGRRLVRRAPVPAAA